MKEFKLNFKEVSLEINNLQGKILTIIEALNLPINQEKATKDLIKSAISDAHNKIGGIKFEIPVSVLQEYESVNLPSKLISISSDENGTLTK